ncbi:N-acetylmuramoyl-L-alanine amidase [Luteipulveratus sp. YIM 133132]|uniref:peptidoglycan recognition protein family protein n=1 Tax=Luteipulveratus flavus TaxID=3031728 RepID=UPI0023B10119|nr:N-acetylmuramoyl-L-alanine amidase [Luteipulveratus sp. YIM 133132]MDE9365483.1 N-acetylmuramoyl-L-alanine amidase [Luteipulveratus sp. YIM 133132]
MTTLTTDSPLATSYVQATNYYEGRNRPIRVAVFHTMEYPERPTGAEWCLNYFAGKLGKAPMASVHYTCDADSIGQGVREKDTAFTTPGANADGISVEHAGYAAQRDDATGWQDDYSTRLLDNSARLFADICTRNRIPLVHLSDAQLAAGARGIIGHDQATRVYRKSTHTDPGTHFPWSRFMAAVVKAAGRPAPAPSGQVLSLGSVGENVRHLQQGLNRVFPTYSRLSTDGSYGPRTVAVIREFQTRAKAAGRYTSGVDGITGPATRKALASYGVTF